jgi:RNA polymerase sigma factor (sigma-70 family)
MTIDTDEMVKLARDGSREALENLIKGIQDRIYRLALKMMQHPIDAEDAAQEILIKIITNLDGFRGESSFNTWALTISANHLKNRIKSKAKMRWTFKDCEDAVLREKPDIESLNYFKGEQDLVVEEMRIACMQSLLQCLDADLRLAYILGSAMELSGAEGAAVLGISEPAFRKRLSRARTGLRDFLTKNCDLFNKENPCNCKSQAVSAINRGKIDPDNFKFVGKPVSKACKKNVEAHLATLDTLSREVALMRINQDYKAPEIFIQGIQELIENRTL